jgi:hypothetical protein
MGLHHIFADVLGFSQQPTSPLLLWDLTNQSAQLVFILFEPIERFSKVLGPNKIDQVVKSMFVPGSCNSQCHVFHCWFSHLSVGKVTIHYCIL